MKIDQTLAKIFKKHGGDPDKDLWNCHGVFVAYHKALERVATKAGITFDLPHIIEGDGDKWAVAIVVTGHMGEQTEWSIGEASQHNYRTKGNQTAFPFAMAEKRGKDRVILKLLGLHGDIYSEEEADDFKKPSAFKARKDGDYEKIEAEIRGIESPATLEKWGKDNAARINKLPDKWVELARDEYADRMAKIVAAWTGGEAHPGITEDEQPATI